MALAIPYPRAEYQERNWSGRPATTTGTTLTASATPHSLGTKVELIASTLNETGWISVHIHAMNIAATNTDALVNIYIGAGGAEQVLIPNLAAGWSAVWNSNNYARTYWFPLRIPRASRLSADLRALIVSDTCKVTIGLFGATGWSGAGVEQVGAVTASSRGTTVTPGAASEGTFTTIGTTGRRYRYILPVCMGNADVTMTGDTTAIDIGTGSALLAGLEDFITFSSSNEVDQADGRGRFVDIASGTALQARLQNATSGVEAKSVIIYGVF